MNTWVGGLKTDLYGAYCLSGSSLPHLGRASEGIDTRTDGGADTCEMGYVDGGGVKGIVMYISKPHAG